MWKRSRHVCVGVSVKLYTILPELPRDGMTLAVSLPPKSLKRKHTPTH